MASRAGPRYNPARSLILSGSLERRLVKLERQLTPPGSWTRAGQPYDSSPRVRLLIAKARRHAEGRRWRVAVQAYDLAEQFLYRARTDVRRGVHTIAATELAAGAP